MKYILHLQKFFSEFRWTDEIGSGVKNVNKYLKLYANGAKPLFIEDDDFKTIIPLSRPVLGNRAEQLLEFSDIDKSIPGHDAINILKDISIHPDLNRIKDFDAFLFKMGLSWAEKGVKLKELRIQINSELEFSEFKKGSSWAEKGVKLLKKRSMNILKLLIFTLIPAKIDELKINMDFGSRDKLRELYLNPLRKSELIEFTIKDKPNDPNQKYVITEKGEMFLGGFDV